MKVLQINNKKGEYLKSGTSYSNIKDITKEDLKSLIEFILFNDGIEVDELGEDNEIVNPVERIIYEKISIKINQLLSKKDNLIKSVENNYKELYEKYNLEEFNINNE